MKKFIVIYYAPMDAMKQAASSTPEEQQKGMEGWMIWAEKCGDHLIDMGAPLANGIALTTESSNISTKEVTGYSVLQANDMKHAETLLQGHPHLGWNGACSIEVYETMPLPGM